MNVINEEDDSFYINCQTINIDYLYRKISCCVCNQYVVFRSLEELPKKSKVSYHEDCMLLKVPNPCKIQNMRDAVYFVSITKLL